MNEMATPVTLPIDRLAERQRKAGAYAQAKREQLAPLQAERAALLKTLDSALGHFMNSALPDLEPATLAPFDQAVAENFLDVSPTALVTKLRQQSASASKLCQRYEKEFNIYQLAEYLPDAERRLAELRGQLADAQRAYERLDAQLEPLAALNEKLGHMGLMPVTPETAAQFTRSPGLKHYARLLRDTAYRMAYPTVATLETPSVTIADRLHERLRLQQELVVREQAAELAELETTRQRIWVEAFVTAWTSRLSEKQVLAEVRQAMADLMYEPGFRNSIQIRFERRYPVSLNTLFEQIDAIDARSRRFLLAFDANYEAGRIDPATDTPQRQRNATSV